MNNNDLTSPIHHLTVNEIVNHRSFCAVFVSRSTTDKAFNFHQVFKLLREACHAMYDEITKCEWCITGCINRQYYSVFFADHPRQIQMSPSIIRPTLIAFDQPIDTTYYAHMSLSGFKMIHGKKVIDAYPKKPNVVYKSRPLVSDACVDGSHLDHHHTDYAGDNDDHSDARFQRLTHQPLITSH